MSCKIDLTGQKFGRLTVLEDVGRTKSKQVIWRCRCDCGNIVDVVAQSLRSGNTQSCGCYANKQTSKRCYKSLVGQKFGRLTVLEDVGRTKHGSVIWKCLCDCGNTVEVITATLQRGHTKSCGCYSREQTSEINKVDLTNQKFGYLTVLEDVGRKHHEVLWRCLCKCGAIVEVITSSLRSGNTQSCGCYKRERISETRSGENHPNWKGGVTPLNVVIRGCTRYRTWRRLNFQRDNFICAHCGIRGGKLHAHHIIRFSVIMAENYITTLEEALQCEALWNIDNGLTLCKKCHKKLHSSEGLDNPEEIDYITP